MAGSDQEQGPEKPSEQRGGTTPDAVEAAQKGFGGEAAEGIVPADLGGSDAPKEMLGDDPQLGSSVLGGTTGSDEPATDDGGVDLSAGDEADATSDGGAEQPPEGVEPDYKDAANISGRQPGLESAS